MDTYKVIKDIEEGWETGAKEGDILTLRSWNSVPTLIKDEKAVCDLDSDYGRNHCVAMEDKLRTYRLSYIIDRNDGKKVNIKSIVGQYHTFRDSNFKVGVKLNFRDLDQTFGLRFEGEIESVRTETIRKREYTVLTTKLREYYLTEYQRQG